VTNDDSFLLPNGSKKDSLGFSAEEYEAVGLYQDQTGQLKPTNKLVAMFAVASVIDYAVGMVGTILFAALAGYLVSITPGLGEAVAGVLSQVGLTRPLWKIGATLGVLNALWELTVRSRFTYTRLADYLAGKMTTKKS
jgi:hypothetical protein